MESEFGLETYLGDRTLKVPCILKELYSDFIVQEILEDGTVLRFLSDQEIRAQNKVVKVDDSLDVSIPVPSFITEEVLSDLDSLLQTESEKTSVDILTTDLAKDERKSIHGFVRSRYRGKLQSETSQNKIVVTLDDPKKRKRWHPDTPSHCHFTLAKENKDTSFALSLIAKFLHMKPSAFRSHGIKDRRAATTQRISSGRIDKSRLLSLNNRLKGVRLYDFEFKSSDLKMGGHSGNRFSIILRSINPEHKNVLEERLNEIGKQGFLNYFGTQRFGSCDRNTATVGKYILQRKWELAVRYIFSDVVSDSAYTVGHEDPLNNLKYVGKPIAANSIESMIQKCLSNGGTWQQCITEAIPMNMRSLYVHAYQSLLWNQVASRRIKLSPDSCIEGDMGSDGKLLGENASIFDVYIPLPGGMTTFDSNYANDWYKDLLAKDDLTFESFVSLEDRFALGDCVRAFIAKPIDLSWKFYNYTQPRCYLQDGLSTKAIPESERVGPNLALQVQFSLVQGLYATVLLRQITGIDMGKSNMKELCRQNGTLDNDPEDAEAADDIEENVILDPTP
ncbi:unnamed protein product [Auanema sp. JU1783]|nr:unnamed protein product [Auanema sp. JU1783]